MRSIERNLMLLILGAAALGATLLGATAYSVIDEDLNQTLDDTLQAVALAVADRHAPQLPGAPANSEPGSAEILVVEWTPTGHLASATNPAVPLRFTATQGLTRQRVQGVDWDVYTATRPSGVVQAAQRASSQQQAVAQATADLLLPFAGVFGLSSVLLVLGLRRGLKPLESMAGSLALRGATSLEPIDARPLPREIKPLVLALNGLMDRLSNSLQARQRFVADAAHELRTPITALRLQLQLLQGAADEASRHAAIEALQSGVERSQHLVEQLLELSRAEPGSLPPCVQRIELAVLVQSAVGRYSAKADSRGIDLGAVISAPGELSGDGEQLRVLLDNLIGNALRFTPRGGVVDVMVVDTGGCAMLRVLDDGPGIAAEARGQVFERFHRVPGIAPAHVGETGSGLGLAIVSAIAERHNALVTLHTGLRGRGLEVRVVFPRTAACP